MENQKKLAARRRTALQLGVAAVARFSVGTAQAAQNEVRIVTNGGIENRTTIVLLSQQGYFDKIGVKQKLVLVKKPDEALAALVENKADACITSAYDGVLPAIAKGAEVKIIGGAMQRIALAVYSAKPEINSVSDLIGRSVGIGPKFGLLHVVMLALFRARGLDPDKVRFVHVGSNLEVYRAVEAQKVDAGLSDVSHTLAAKAGGLHILADGRMWNALPNYPYQLAYAADRALRDNRAGVEGALVAYGKLFRFLSAPNSWAAYAAAHEAAGGSAETAKAVWSYIQQVNPYEGSPDISAARIDYLQNIDVALGLQKAVLPIEAVADLSLARGAMNRL